MNGIIGLYQCYPFALVEVQCMSRFFLKIILCLGCSYNYVEKCFALLWFF